MEVKEFKDALKVGLDEASKENQKALDSLKGQFEEMVKEKAGIEALKDIEAKMHTLANQQDEIQTALKNQKAGVGRNTSFAGDFVKNIWTADNIESLKAGKMISGDMDIKAVSNMTTSYAATSGLRDIFADVESGVSSAPKVEPTVLDYISIGATNSEILKWVIKTTVEGGFGQVAEGDKFAQVSYKWDAEQATAKKTAGYSKISKDSIENLPFIQTETVREMTEDILLSVAAQVMSGDNTGQNHKGVKEYAAAFARQTGVGTLTGVTEWDVLAHAALQVSIAGKGKFRPNACFISPKDKTMIKTIKDSTGQYVVPIYLSNSGMDIDGIPLVVDHSLAAGEFVLGDFKKFGWFNFRQMSFNTYEQNEDDVLKDFLTVTGSLRAVSRVKTTEVGAFVKGTFSTAITALEA